MTTAIETLSASDDVFTEENLLRSINIVFDAEHPERIRHFFPTTKTLELLRKMNSQEQTPGMFIIAPYGSGKSLLASFFQKVAENQEDVLSILRPVFDRLENLDPALASDIAKRSASQQMFRPTGVSVPIVGYVRSLPHTIRAGIADSLQRTRKLKHAESIRTMPAENMDDLLSILVFVREQLSSEVDSVEILWDEFGRHLEEIIVRGEAHRLNELQTLSEFGARSKRIKFGLSLFLHQGLMRYATNVPQGIIGEWKKVEGRFATTQYVDDSKEIVSLAARVLHNRFPDEPSAATLQDLLEIVQNVGFFNDLKPDELSQLIRSSWPVLPAALYALPRLSSRVAQNERTLFSFLFSLNPGNMVTVADVYDYFSDLMRSDATFGGTYHHWLETSSTLEHTDSLLEERIIKTLSVLGLGLSGDRNRVSLELLIAAASLPGEIPTVRAAVHKLIDRKVLLYRKNSDTVLLWHANDIDLRGLLESEKARMFVGFDLLTYLNEFLPPEDWRPVEYNSRFKMFRFFRGSYVSARDASKIELLSHSWNEFGGAGDGAVLYVLPETKDDIEQVRHRLTKTVTIDERLIWLLPRSIEGLFETALEAAAIARLLRDTSLAAEDPLVVPELEHLLDDAQTYLSRLVDRMFLPSPEGPEVISRGISHSVKSRSEFRSFLSSVVERVYPATPVFNNELINKNNPTQVLVNSRKKLVLGILDRYGTEDLGIEGNRPDRSMFATILLRTGLYFRDENDRWRFAQPHELSDQNLREVWQIVHDFFTEAHDRGKTFGELYAQLEDPPIGIRRGIIPILIAAGFRAFPAAMTLSDPYGDYIPDIKPTVVEEIAKRPDDYRLRIIPLSETARAYLDAVESIFSGSSSGVSAPMVETDPLRRCFDAIEAWKASLPVASLQSRRFDDRAHAFQRLISRAKDPARLLFTDILQTYGVTLSDWEKLTEHMANWKHQLENVVEYYFEVAGRSVLSALHAPADQPVREAGLSWVGVLPDDIANRLSDGVSQAIVQRFQVTYDSDAALIDSLSSLLIGKKIERWDDSTISLFERELRNVVGRVEDAALNAAASHNVGFGKELIASRINNLFSRLCSVVGEEQARQIVAEIIKEE